MPLVNLGSENYEKDENVIRQMFAKKDGTPEERAEFKAWIAPQLQRMINAVIVQHFAPYVVTYGEDMFSEGFIGIWKHIDGYEPDKGNLGTYFTPRILHEITLYIKQFIHTTTAYGSIQEKKVIKAMAELSNKGIDKPDITQIAAITGMKPNLVRKAMSSINFTNSLSLEENMATVSTIGDDFADPERKMLALENYEQISKAMGNLTSQEREVLCRRFGVFGHEKMNNEKIFHTTGITKDKINFLLNSGLTKMRTCPALNAYIFGRESKIKDDIELEPLVTTPDAAAQKMYDDVLLYDQDSGTETHMKDLEF